MKKRVFSLLLCLALLLSSVALFSSCKKDGGDETKISSKIIDVDLKGYAIITGIELTEDGEKQAFSLSQSIAKLTSADLGVTKDQENTVIESDNPEMLIGETSREESLDALDSIRGEGWVIRVYPKTNKVVIVGTTSFLTRVAMTYFDHTFLNAEHANNTVLSLNEKTLVSDMMMVPLTENIDDVDTTYTVVCEGSDYYPYELASQVYDSVTDKAGMMSTIATSVGNPVEKEILVGNMNRPEMKEEIAKIEANEYAVSVRDGKVFLVAWSDAALSGTFALFEEMLSTSAVTDEEGNTTYSIPANCRVVQSYSDNWVTDFPRPTGENIAPHGAVDVGEGSLQYVYSGSGVNRESFVAYCETLKAAGFTAMGDEDVQLEGSSFRTFVNTNTNVSLHVSHMAYTHATSDSGILNSIRIVASTMSSENITQPNAQYFRPQVEGADYEWKMNSRITSNNFDYSNTENWGFGQLITLSDGSFIVLDGGRAKGTDEAANLWLIMRKMHKEAYGEFPTKENPAHIRAWIITHEHGDHQNLIMNFCSSFGELPELRFDYLFFNPGSNLQIGHAGPNRGFFNNLKTYQEKIGFEWVSVQSGQVFYFANCRLEILYTPDDLYPQRMNGRLNNESLIVRTFLREEDDEGNSHESSCMWVGDAEAQAVSVACAMYGTYLASEQVSLSHHGYNNGANMTFYNYVGKPTVIWFPNTVGSGWLDSCFKSSTFVNIIKNNAECKLIIFNGVWLNNGPRWEITLKITAKGPAYDDLYDAGTGESIEPTDRFDVDNLNPIIDVPAYKVNLAK